MCQPARAARRADHSMKLIFHLLYELSLQSRSEIKQSLSNSWIVHLALDAMFPNLTIFR